jgi:hypothetical protein
MDLQKVPNAEEQAERILDKIEKTDGGPKATPRSQPNGSPSEITSTPR